MVHPQPDRRISPVTEGVRAIISYLMRLRRTEHTTLSHGGALDENQALFMKVPTGSNVELVETTLRARPPLYTLKS